MPLITPKYPSSVAAASDLLVHANKVPSQSDPTLLNSILAGDTSLTLNSGGGAMLPTDNFVMSVENEIIFVSSVTGDVCNGLTRGFEGTTPAGHNAGVAVEPRVTALAHNRLASEVNSVESTLGVRLNNVFATNVASISSNTTLDNTYSIVLVTTSSSIIPVTLPTAVGIMNKVYVIKKVDSGTGYVSLGTTSSQTIDGNTSYYLSNRWQYIVVVSDNSNWLIIGNN